MMLAEGRDRPLLPVVRLCRTTIRRSKSGRPLQRRFSGSERPRVARTPEIVVALDVLGDDNRSARNVVDAIIKAVQAKSKTFVGDSPDLPFAATDDGASAKHPSRSLPTGRRRSACLTSTYCACRRRRIGKALTSSLSTRARPSGLGQGYGDGWTVGSAYPGNPRPQPGTVRRPTG